MDLNGACALNMLWHFVQNYHEKYRYTRACLLGEFEKLKRARSGNQTVYIVFPFLFDQLLQSDPIFIC